MARTGARPAQRSQALRKLQVAAGATQRRAPRHEFRELDEGLADRGPTSA
jgi:hypothetical protein